MYEPVSIYFIMIDVYQVFCVVLCCVPLPVLLCCVSSQGASFCPVVHCGGGALNCSPTGSGMTGRVRVGAHTLNHAYLS